MPDEKLNHKFSLLTEPSKIVQNCFESLPRETREDYFYRTELKNIEYKKQVKKSKE